MPYQYDFDETTVGDMRLSLEELEILQTGYRLLRDELSRWNDRAIERGAVRPPYEREVKDLNRIIEWGNDESLSAPRIACVLVRGISVGSCRYAKAALMLLAHSREQDLENDARQGWPEGALESLRETIGTIKKVVDRFQFEPSNVLWEVMPRMTHQEPDEIQTMEWDVFISHASEDKEDLVRPLAERLRSEGLRVWFDEMTLAVGDSLRRSIDRGLAHSRYGIVVISPHFLEKEWPQRELDGLVARETNGVKTILPIWHNISAEEIRKKSPTLADRVATTSDKGLDKNIEDFLRAISKDKTTTTPPR